MARRAQVIRQRDFSGGELIPDMQRQDATEQHRAGARAMRNWRVNNSNVAQERPGRRAIFKQEGRTETILLPGDLRFRFSFGNGTVVIRDSTGATVGSNTGYPWATATVRSINWCVINRDVVMCFPASRIKVARRNDDASWSFFDFTFATGSLGQLQAPFYRFNGTSGITLTPSALTGSITLTTSAAFFNAGHVGVNLRYKNRQVNITAVTNATTATATVLEQLPPSQTLTFTSATGFFVGQVISGSVTNATGEVTAVTATTVTCVLNTLFTGFTTGDVVIGPTARATPTAVGTATPQPTVQWDEQAASDYRGWPRACLFDRNRLALCDLPQVPEGIIWSSVASYQDFYVGSDPSVAIFETVPGRARVLYMTGGPDQFVFTDKGVFYIPISESNPLKPGSVAFRLVNADAIGPVPPIQTADGIVFVNAGQSRVMALSPAGTTTRPYVVDDITAVASHLVKTPVCIASYTGDGDIPDRYLFVVNTDGTVICGKVRADRKFVGWTPWDGVGLVNWISSLRGETLFSTNYVGTNTQPLVEVMDDSADLDGRVTYNSVVSQLAPPGAGLTGPLWMYAGLTVTLMDGTRDLGDRSVDSTGALVPVLGDDFSASTVTAGLTWTMEFEPFIRHAEEGSDISQTMRVRRVKQMAIKVRRSVGFDLGARSIPAYQWGEEGGNAPTPREETYRFKKLGNKIDPRVSMTRSRPGTISLLEFSTEVTI